MVSNIGRNPQKRIRGVWLIYSPIDHFAGIKLPSRDEVLDVLFPLSTEAGSGASPLSRGRY